MAGDAGLEPATFRASEAGRGLVWMAIGEARAVRITETV